MTREEQIREVAEEYSAYKDSVDEEEFYNSTELEAFMDGAKWADNHPAKKQLIWHNVNETPSENSEIVVIDTKEEWYNISYSFDDYDDCFGKGWESCVRTYNIHKWAYLTDLTNL